MKKIEFTKDCGRTRISVMVDKIIAVEELQNRCTKLYTMKGALSVDGEYEEIIERLNKEG